jgi:hypothetical protein
MTQCRMVLWLQMQLSHRMWCCSCCRCTARGVAGAVIGLYYVMVMVAMPRAVSWLLLSRCVVLSLWSRHIWCRGHSCRAVCCGCCRHTVRGVAGAIVGLHYIVVACGVMVTIVMPCGTVVAVVPRVMSRSQSSCCVVLRSLWLSSCHWCHSHSHRRGGIVVTVGVCTVAGPGGGGQSRIRQQGW